MTQIFDVFCYLNLFMKIGEIVYIQGPTKEFETVIAHERNVWSVHFNEFRQHCVWRNEHLTWPKACNQWNKVRIAFVACLQAMQKNSNILVTIDGNWLKIHFELFYAVFKYI